MTPIPLELLHSSTDCAKSVIGNIVPNRRAHLGKRLFHARAQGDTYAMLSPAALMVHSLLVQCAVCGRIVAVGGKPIGYRIDQDYRRPQVKCRECEVPQ